MKNDSNDIWNGILFVAAMCAFGWFMCNCFVK